MYKCKNCKSIINNFGTHTESHGEKWSTCFSCGSTNIVELSKPKEIEACELLEMLVHLCGAYNVKPNSYNQALDYAIERVRMFISETINDDEIYTDLKLCKSVSSVQKIIDYIYEIYEEKE